jgi:hypothetical protein
MPWLPVIRKRTKKGKIFQENWRARFKRALEVNYCVSRVAAGSECPD